MPSEIYALAFLVIFVYNAYMTQLRNYSKKEGRHSFQLSAAQQSLKEEKLMKFNWKRLAALLLAVILMLSLTGMGEEELTIADDASTNAAEIEDVLGIDDALTEPDLVLDDPLELNLSDDILN